MLARAAVPDSAEDQAQLHAEHRPGLRALRAHPSWHQPFLLSWIHIDKGVWNGLPAAQRAAITRAAKESVSESYRATESMECAKLRAILDINQGVGQRNIDGTPRLVDGKPVSAAMTLATWPDDALAALQDPPTTT